VRKGELKEEREIDVERRIRKRRESKSYLAKKVEPKAS
jgi:hypothetical protein